MRKSFVAALSAIAIITFATASFASWPPGIDKMGLYSADDGTGYCNLDVGVGPITIYLVLTGCSIGAGVHGWECRFTYTLSAGLFEGAATLYGSAINIGTLPDYIVGLSAPLPRAGDDSVVLATFGFLAGAADIENEFFLGPVSIPSIPGAADMIFAAGDDEGNLLLAHPANGDYANPAFQINLGPLTPTPVPTENETWGGVKNLYR